MTIAGNFVWLKARKGFVAEKHPLDYVRPKDAPEPVATYPLGADEFRMSILILEQRFPAPKEMPTPETAS